MDQDLDQLISILERRGLKGGLKWLNDRVPHRWTAIYKLDRVVVVNQLAVDKLKKIDLCKLVALPLKDSFCQFAMRDGEFIKRNTSQDDDPRLIDHMYKGVVNSYVGLPLMENSDALYGTFCHFDTAPQVISDDEFAFLQKVARVLPLYLDHSLKHVQPLSSAQSA